MIVVLLPPLAFLIAAAIELRSRKSVRQKFGTLIPIVLGFAAFVLWLNPQGILHVTADSSVNLSRVMTIFSAAIASSGSFIAYSRRTSSILTGLGGLILAFGWMFNYVVV